MKSPLSSRASNQIKNPSLNFKCLPEPQIKFIMKTISLVTLALFLSVVGQAQPTPPSSQAAVPAKYLVNYVIRVEWKDPKSDSKFLEVMTTPGNFQLDTIQKTSVKINNNDIPVTLKLTGTLAAFDDQKGKLQLFIGQSVPYVTGTYGGGLATSSSYSSMSVGLQSTFAVTFGKPLTVQIDDNGEISVLVKREAD